MAPGLWSALIGEIASNINSTTLCPLSNTYYIGRPHLKKGMTRTHEVGWLVWRFSKKGPQKMGFFC